MSYSVASLLIHRHVWEAVGGFVEGLRTGEDILFVQRLREGRFAIGLAPGAIVDWQIPQTLRGTMRRLATYSHYGLEAGLGHTWHYRAFAYYGVALLLIVMGLVHSRWWLALLAGLFVLRVVKTILCNEKVQRGLRGFGPLRIVLVGWILLAMDLATLYGTLRWMIFLRIPRPAGTLVSR